MRTAYQTSVWRSRVYRVNLISKPTISADPHRLHPDPPRLPFQVLFRLTRHPATQARPNSLFPSSSPCHPDPPPPPFSKSLSPGPSSNHPGPPRLPVLFRPLSPDPPPNRIRHDLRHRLDELRPRVERRRPPDLDPALAREGLGLHVEVVEDLEVVGDKPDRANEHVLGA